MPAPDSTATADSLDAPVRLVSGRLWAGFAALALLIAGVLAWALVATVPQHVSASGVILHGAQAVTVRATSAGSLASAAVTPGTAVRRGQVLGTFATGDRRTEVTAPVDGTVISVIAAPGRSLLVGAPLVAIDATAEPARAVLLVSSAREVARLAPGQHVDLAGPVASSGRVSSATLYPVSADDLMARFGTVDVPGFPRDSKPTWLVDVALDDRSAQAAPSLSPVAASILVDRVRPDRLVLGGSR